MEVNITAQDESKVLSQSADIPDSNNSSLNEQNVECANTSKNSDFASETIVSFLTPVSSPALLSPIKSVLTYSNESTKIQPESKSIETEKCDSESENIQKTETIVQNENSHVNEYNYNNPKKSDNKNIKFNYQVNRKIYGKNKRTSHVTNIPSLLDIKTVKPEFMSPQNNFPQLQRFDNQNFSPQYNIAQSFTNYNIPQFNENPNFPLQFNELPAFAQNQSSPQLMDQNPLSFNIQRFDDQNCPVSFNSLNEQNLLHNSQFEIHNQPPSAPFSSDQIIEFNTQLPPPFFDRQLPSTALSSIINEDDDQNPNNLLNIQLPADSTPTSNILKDDNPSTAVSIDKQDKTSNASNTEKTEVKYSPEDTMLDKPIESEKYPEQKESPVATRPVLGREQAKKRLQAFSLMKFGLAKQDKNKKVLSPVKKVQLTVEEAYDENGEKIEVVSVKKPPKKGPCHLERAKAVISEIEEMKRREVAFTVIQAQSFAGLLPIQASKLIKSVEANDDASKLDQKDHKKSKESDSYKIEKSGSKEKHKYSNKSDVKKPSSWNDVKEWGYDMAMIRQTKSKRSYRSDSDCTKLEECLGALDGVVKMRNSLNVKTQNGNIKVYPQEIVKYTSKSPSISYSENPKNCQSFFPNRTRVLAVTPVSRAEICNKFISDSLSPKNFSDKPMTSRNWFGQDFLMPMPNAEPKDEKLITKGYGLSVLTENYKNTNWDESDDEKETEETVLIKTVEENIEQPQTSENEPINQVIEKSEILEKPLKHKEDTVTIKNDRRASDECDRKGMEKSDKIKHSVEKTDSKKSKEKHLEPIEKEEQQGSMALQDTSKTNVNKNEKEEKVDKQHDVKNNEYSKQTESVDRTSDRCRTPNTDEYRPDWELGEDILPPDIDTNCLGIPKLNELSPKNWESDDDYFKTDRNIRKELHLKEMTEDKIGKYRNTSNENKTKDVSRENYSHKKDSKSREKTDEKDRYFNKKYSENNTKSYDEVKDNSKSKNKSKDYSRSNQRHNISTDSEKEMKSDSKVKIDSRPRDASRSRSRGDSRPKSRSDSRSREDLRPREKIDNYKRNRSRSTDEKKFEPNINERVRDDFIFNEKLYSEPKISGDRNRNEMKWNEERLSPERYRGNWDFPRRQDDDYNRTKDDLRFRGNSKYDDLHSDFKSFNMETDKYREDRKFSELFDHELNERRDYNQQYERGMKTDEYNELFDRPCSIKEPHDYEVGQKYRGDEKGYRYSPQISNHNDDTNYKSSHRNDWEEEDDIKPDYRKEEHWNDRRKWEEYQRSPYENFRENCWRDKNWEKEDDYRYSKDGRRLRWQEWQDEQINEFRMRERKLHSDERYHNDSYFLDKDYLERNDDRLRRSLEKEGYNKSRRSAEKQDTERRSLEREGYNKPRYPEKSDIARRSLEREGYNKPRYPDKTDITRRSLEREGYNKPRYPEKIDTARRSLEREDYNKPRYPEKTDTTRRSLERESYNKPRYPEKADTTRRSLEREGYNKPRYPEKVDNTRRSPERESYNKSRRLSEKQDVGKLKSSEKDNSNKRRKSYEEHSIDDSRVAEKENTNKKRLSEKHDVDKLKKLSDKEYYKSREPIEKQEIHKEKEGNKSKREKLSADKSRKSAEREGYTKSKQDIDKSIEKEDFYNKSRQDDKSLEKGNNKSKKSSEKETAQSKWSPERKDDKKLTDMNVSKKLLEQKESSRSEKNSDQERNSDKVQKSIEKENSYRSKKSSEKGIIVDKFEETLEEIDLHKSKKSTEKDYDKSKRRCIENDDGETYKLLEDTSKNTKRSEKDNNDRKKDIAVENKTKNSDYKEKCLVQPDELIIRPVSPNLKSNDKLVSEYEEFIKTVGCESENDPAVNKEDNTDNSTKTSTTADSSESSSEEINKKSKKKTLSKRKSKSPPSSYESSSESEEEIPRKHKKSTQARKKNEKSKSKKTKKVSSESSSGSSTSESSSASTSSTDSSSESSSSSSSSTSSSSSSSESEEASKSKERLSVEKIKIKEEKLTDDEKKVTTGASKKRKRESSDSSDVSSSSTSSSSEDESEESDQTDKAVTDKAVTDKAVTDNSEVIKSYINKKVNCEENLTKDNVTKPAEKSDEKEHPDEIEDFALVGTIPKTQETDKLSTVFENIKGLQIPTKIYQLSDYKQSMFEKPVSFSLQSNKKSIRNTDVDTADEHNIGTPVISCDNDLTIASGNQKELLHSELANNPEAGNFNISRTLNSSITDSLLHKRTYEDDNENVENQNKKLCTDNLMSKIVDESQHSIKNECDNTENYPNNFNLDSTSQYLVKDKSDFESKHDEFRSSSRQKSEIDYRRDYSQSGRPRDSLERSDRSRSRGSKRDRYEYERSSKRSRHSRSRSRDRSRNRDHSKRARSRERHRSKDRERSREDYDINRDYDRRSERGQSQTKRESHRIPKDVENVDSIPLPERMWHGNSDLTYMNMELVKSPSSPLDGFKRSVADSTISDSELLRMQAENSYYNEIDKRNSSDLKKYKPALPASPMDSPIVSPRRISLDDRINQVLGIDKEETPKPIETVGSHEGTYSNYYDQYHGFAQQYDNYRMPMKSMVPPLPTNYYQGMQICRETTPHGSQVLQVGNVLQVVPTELPPAVDKVQATVLPPQNVNKLLKNVSTTKVVQVGNMLQIVPTVITTEKKTKPKLSDLPLPPVHDVSEESPQPATETVEVEAEKEETKPIQEDEVALRRKERAKRRADREQRRKEKESKRVEKEKRRELRIKLRTENMIKRALQLETRELSLNLDESEILQGTEDNEKNEKSGPTMWPPPMLAPIPLAQPPAKGILITSGFSKLKNKEDANLDEETSKKIVKKSVKFADGICPGEGTSPSGGEELPSPPPPSRKLPKEQRYKKTKLKTKKKVKVKIIRNAQQAADEEDDEDDNLPPPPPPPGSPPPHLWPKQSRPNNINPTVGFAHPSTNQPYHPVLSTPAAFGIQAQMGPGPPGAYPPSGPMASYPPGFQPVGPPPPSGPYPGYTFQPRPGYNAPGGNCIPRVSQPPGGVYHPPVYPVTGSPARPFGPPPPPMQAHPPVYGMAYNNLSSSKSHRKTIRKSSFRRHGFIQARKMCPEL